MYLYRSEIQLVILIESWVFAFANNSGAHQIVNLCGLISTSIFCSLNGIIFLVFVFKFQDCLKLAYCLTVKAKLCPMLSEPTWQKTCTNIFYVIKIAWNHFLCSSPFQILITIALFCASYYTISCLLQLVPKKDILIALWCNFLCRYFGMVAFIIFGLSNYQRWEHFDTHIDLNAITLKW